MFYVCLSASGQCEFHVSTLLLQCRWFSLRTRLRLLSWAYEASSELSKEVTKKKKVAEIWSNAVKLYKWILIESLRPPYPYFWLIDDIGSLQGDSAQVEVAPGPEGCHHIGDDDIECLIIAGIHEEVCGAARGPQGLFPHTFITNTIITSISQTDKETTQAGRGTKNLSSWHIILLHF